MLEEYTKYRVLEQFFRKPNEKRQLRSLSRETDISLPTVKKYVEELEDEGLLEKIESGTYPGFQASLNDDFKLEKKLWTQRKLHETGFLEKLEQKFHPTAIVLFGSAARGEDTEKSDLDVLVMGREKQIELEKYEEEFNRKINLQFMTENQIMKNKEFSNSIANGIVLKGFLRVK